MVSETTLQNLQILSICKTALNLQINLFRLRGPNHADLHIPRIGREGLVDKFESIPLIDWLSIRRSSEVCLHTFLISTLKTPVQKLGGQSAPLIRRMHSKDIQIYHACRSISHLFDDQPMRFIAIFIQQSFPPLQEYNKNVCLGLFSQALTCNSDLTLKNA